MLWSWTLQKRMTVRNQKNRCFLLKFIHAHLAGRLFHISSKITQTINVAIFININNALNLIKFWLLVIPCHFGNLVLITKEINCFPICIQASKPLFKITHLSITTFVFGLRWLPPDIAYIIRAFMVGNCGAEVRQVNAALKAKQVIA